MADLFPPSLDDQVSAVKREIALRERAYPKFVADGRMSSEKAGRELAAMRAALGISAPIAPGRRGAVSISARSIRCGKGICSEA